MTSPIGATRIALVKTLAIAGLAAAMQATMLIVVVATGKVLFALPGLPPAHLLASGTLVAVACVPLAAFQSSISMLIRSFAGAVALAAALAGVPREEVVAVPLVVEPIDPLGGRRLRHRGQHGQDKKCCQHCSDEG